MKGVNRVVGIIVLIPAIYLFMLAIGWREGMDIMPKFVLGMIIFLSVLLIITGGAIRMNQDYKPFKGIDFSRLIVTIILTIFYVVIIKVLGFYTSSLLFLMSLYFYLGYRRKGFFIVTAVFAVICLYVIFTVWLKVPVLRGLLF